MKIDNKMENGVIDRDRLHGLRKLRLYKSLAFFWLTLENILILLFFPVLLFLALCAFWMFGLHTLLGAFANFAAFMAGVVLLGWSVRVILPHLRPLHAAQIYKRIESGNHLPHGLLQMAEDRPANPEKIATRDLWSLKQAKIFYALRFMKPPRPRLAPLWRDRYALQNAVLILAMAGCMAAGPAWRARIESGFQALLPPSKAAVVKAPDLTFEPPFYTGLKNLPVTDENRKRVFLVPEGSVLHASAMPETKVGLWKIRAGKNVSVFQKDENGVTAAAMVLPANAHSVRLCRFFFCPVGLRYKLIPDRPPQLAWQADPEILPDGTLRFPVKARDDYGITAVEIEMRHANDPPYIESRVIASPGGDDIALYPVFDLTGHEWTGENVTVILRVLDGKGQMAALPPVPIKLPERVFHDKIARQIAAMRKALLQNPLQNYTSMARAMEMFLIEPSVLQGGNGLFLSVRAAASRLFWSPPSAQDAAEIAQLLWAIALHIEQSDFSAATDALRKAQEELLRSFAKAGAQGEGQTLDQVIQALQSYMSAYQDNLLAMLRRGQISITVAKNAESLDPGAMNDFLRQLQDAMASGDTATARRMIGSLLQAMDHITASLALLSSGSVQGEGLDPAGRPQGSQALPGLDSSQAIKFPSEAEQTLSQRVLRMLRQKAGEQNRPAREIEYYKRLLERF